MSLILGVAIGLVAGVLAGILGVGGGVITIPGMVLLMKVDQHSAQGVSLAVIIATAAMATVVHYRNGFVKPGTALLIAIPAALFSVAGAYLAHLIDASVLSRLLGVLLLGMGVRMVWK